MRLADFLCEKFEGGIQYEDAAELCMSIYCLDILPNESIDEILNMNNIAEAFADLSRKGMVKNYVAYKAVSFGANYHSVDDKGHWIEVQASILKLKTTFNTEKCLQMLE